MTQESQVLEHLENYGAITALGAFQNYRIMRLAAIICKLKSSGVPIEKEMRYRDGKRWAVYKMAHPASANAEQAGELEAGHFCSEDNTII